MTLRRSKLLLAAAAASIALTGCSSVGGEGLGSDYYSLVRVRDIRVGDGSMVVTPPRPWNRTRKFFLFDDVRHVEDWTLNGPLLDGISFVSGLPNNRYLIRQRRTEDRQVPKFRSDMSAPEIVSMLETLFRARGGAIEFRTTSLAPKAFLGTNGFQLDYEHLDSDELWRRGRAVGAVVNGRLYLVLYDAARTHYFSAAAGDFDAIVASARLR
jgi:hypothetical protein